MDVGTYEIEWTKLEPGTMTTPFISRPYAEELALCQRYYEVFANAQKDYDIPVLEWSTNYSSMNYDFKVTKRVTPSLIKSTSSSNYGRVVYNNNSVLNVSAMQLYASGSDENRVQILCTLNGTPVVSSGISYDTLGSDGMISFDAEIY